MQYTIQPVNQGSISESEFYKHDDFSSIVVVNNLWDSGSFTIDLEVDEQLPEKPETVSDFWVTNYKTWKHNFTSHLLSEIINVYTPSIITDAEQEQLYELQQLAKPELSYYELLTNNGWQGYQFEIKIDGPIVVENIYDKQS